MAVVAASDDNASLICRAGRLLCALPIHSLVETMRPLPVEVLPGAPASVMGSTIIHGVPVPVVDMAHLLGEPQGGPGRFVVIRIGSRRVALAFTEVVGFRSLASTRVIDLPPLLSEASTAAVKALSTLDGGLVLMLESASIVPADVFAALAGTGQHKP